MPEGPGQPGYPPPGQQESPQTEAPPQGYTPQAYTPQPAYAPPAKRSRAGALIVGAIAVILIAVVAGFFLFQDRLSGAAAELAAGACIDLPGEQGSFTDVQRQPCDQAHDAEVFIVLTHPAPPGEAYPVVSGFDDYIEQECVPAFESYTGRTYPNDRGFTCHASRIDTAKLTSGVRAAGAPASP